MGICCVNNNVIEPQSIVDFSNKKRISNKLNRNLIKENEKSTHLKENEKKNSEENLISSLTNNNNKSINEERRENSFDNAYKNISSISQINAGKETNGNSNISEIKKVNKNAPLNKELILNKKKNKKEINFLLLGDKNTGKTCFIIQFIENYFEKNYNPTTGFNFQKKTVSYNTHQYQLNFITKGNEHKENINYYNEADFFLLFYDITNEKSFEIIKNSIENKINKYLIEYLDGTPNIILIGNKIDLEDERKIKLEDVEKYCKEKNYINFEMSVKNNQNINLMMNIILKAFDQISYVG
jgi:small GTP-binding protein